MVWRSTVQTTGCRQNRCWQPAPSRHCVTLRGKLECPEAPQAANSHHVRSVRSPQKIASAALVPAERRLAGWSYFMSAASARLVRAERRLVHDRWDARLPSVHFPTPTPSLRLLAWVRPTFPNRVVSQAKERKLPRVFSGRKRCLGCHQRKDCAKRRNRGGPSGAAASYLSRSHVPAMPTAEPCRRPGVCQDPKGN
jgi:hypothetical protein